MWNSSYRRSDNEPTIPSSGFEFRCITLSVLGTISSPITMDNIKEEAGSATMDTTRESFTGSTSSSNVTNDIKHTDAYNCISDIKEEGINVTEEGDSIMDNTWDRFTSESDDVKVENIYMNDIKSEGISVGIDSDVKEWNNYIYNVSDISQEGTTYYEDNIKEESDSSTMDNIGQNYYTTDNIDMKKEDIDDHMNEIKEEGISQNVDDIRENFTCDTFHIKVENTDCDDDIKADTISYDHGGTEQEDCDEPRGAQDRGNLSEK